MITQVLVKSVGLFVVPLYTRLLTTSEYGEYSIFLSWAEVLIVFATLRIYANGFVVGMTKFSDDIMCYTSSMLGLEYTLGLLFLGIVLVIYKLVLFEFGISLLFVALLGIELLTSAPYNLWAATQRYDYKYKLNAFFVVLSTILTPVIGVLLILILPDKAIGAILGKVIPVACLGIICSVLILKNSRSLYKKKYWKYALGINIPLIFYYLAQATLNQADKIMIRYLVDESAVGIYSVAVSIANILSFITVAVNSSLIPYMFQNLKHEQNLKIKDLTSKIAIGIYVIFLFVIMISPELIKLFVPKQYYDGIWLIAPLVTGGFLNFIYQMYCNVEFYFEMKYYLMCASIGTCICNCIMNYFFIIKYGFYAAAYTTMISHMICMFFHMFCVNKIVNQKYVEKPLDNRCMIVLSILFILFSELIVVLYNYVYVRYGILLFIFVIMFYKRREIITIFKVMQG